MVKMVVSQSGKVTGDAGKIVAYEGQQYSEVINITHPIFPSAQYFIEYKYKNTIYRNKLDSNNNVSIEIRDAGYVQCQLVAIDIETGDIVFKSQSWNLIINQSLKIEESHYPCNAIGHYYKHRPPMQLVPPNYKHHNCADNCEELEKLSIEVANEEDIRFNEIQSIKQELAEIKAYVKMEVNVRSTLNANDLIIPGNYKADINSLNFPKENKEYDLVISTYDEGKILQHAYEIESNKVFYRSATLINEAIPDWDSEWTLLSLQ